MHALKFSILPLIYKYKANSTKISIRCTILGDGDINMENNEESQPSNSKLGNTSDDKTDNESQQDSANQLADLTINPVHRRDSESLKTDSIKNDASSSSASGSKSYNRPPLNLQLLNELEIEANRVAASVDDLTENLTGILRSISALTLDCLETYRNCICKTCDTIDYNIKLMYQLMAKCEELNKVAEPLNTLSQNVKDIKNVLDLFDNTMNPW